VSDQVFDGGRNAFSLPDLSLPLIDHNVTDRVEKGRHHAQVRDRVHRVARRGDEPLGLATAHDAQEQRSG